MMFFQELDKWMPEGVDFIMTVRKENGMNKVMVYTKMFGVSDPAQHVIAPLVLNKATAGELDQNFFNQITSPICRKTGLLLNMKSYEEQLEEAAKKSKENKDKESKLSREDKEKQKKYKTAFEKAGKLESTGKLVDALLKYKEAKELALENEKKPVEDKIREIEGKLAEGSLFGSEGTTSKREAGVPREPGISQKITPPVTKSETTPTNLTPSQIAEVVEVKETSESKVISFDEGLGKGMIQKETLPGNIKIKHQHSHSLTGGDLFPEDEQPYVGITGEKMLPEDEYEGYTEKETSAVVTTSQPIIRKRSRIA